MPSIGQTWVLASIGAVFEMGVLSTLKRLLMESRHRHEWQDFKVKSWSPEQWLNHLGFQKEWCLLLKRALASKKGQRDPLGIFLDKTGFWKLILTLSAIPCCAKILPSYI
jgi:hypothetical protein